MVHFGSSDFYIYEPVQLEDKKVVVPFFFYQDKGKVMAKCLKLRMKKKSGGIFDCRMEVDDEEDFNSEAYQTVEVSYFWNTFSDIRGNDGRKLVDVVEHKLWCLSFLSSETFVLEVFV